MRPALQSLWSVACGLAVLAGSGPLMAGVVINEFVAASNERRLTRDQAGAPRLGTGAAWHQPHFNPSSWLTGSMPAGYSFAGLSTDLTLIMKGKTPSAYFRKEFPVAPAQVSSTNLLILAIQYNDGFIAYLNGREIARGNCGPTNHFVFAQQPAYNPHTNTALLELPIGPANQWLRPGTNILAVQAHNAEQPSTGTDPGRFVQHLPTPEFRINAGLRLQNEPDLIAPGAAGGTWRYHIGRSEPSGGLVDPGLITSIFLPPEGEEDDFDQPAAFSDWVELHNDGPDTISLAGWSLTDDPNLPAKWRFPTNTTLPSYGYLVVLCDSRDEANAPAGPATRLHTNFKLGEDGGYLALHNPSGLLADTCEYPGQVTHASYGRNPADASQLLYLLEATPAAANAGPVLLTRVTPPGFTDPAGNPLPGGLYPLTPMTLHLTNGTAGAQVRYTLDGSEPTEWRGILYTNPIALVQTQDKTGIVVRAASFLPGCLPSKTRTHTYVLRRHTLVSALPALMLNGDPGLDWYLPQGLLAIYGGTYATNQNNNIWLANGPHTYNMVLANGTPAEREIQLEYYFPTNYYPTNQAPLRTTIGARVSWSSYSRPRALLTGASTRSPWVNDHREKPSLNLHFTGLFASGGIDYPFFTNYITKNFNHLRLRAGKNDISNPFITDELVRRLYIHMGHQGARGLFTTLHVNGVYKGIFNLAERFREPFFQNHYRSAEDWDVNYIGTWVDGDANALNLLLSALDRDLSLPGNWQTVTNRIDIDNAADYYLLNIYGSTWDWPGNNYIIARERSAGPNSRFRYGVWDAEGAFAAVTSLKPVNYNTLTKDLLTSGSGTLNRIFRRLATSAEFRLRFADRVNRHMFNGGVLDDRDPDGPGPRKSIIATHLEALTAEVGAAVAYSSGSNIRTNTIHNWMNPVSGRRVYLLGTSTNYLRASGFWPVTEPPQFSQFGGTLPVGTPLSMTSKVATNDATSTIYYTLDRNDPRTLQNGIAATAMAYSSPLYLEKVTTVRARARNDQTGEWSAITEATFGPDAVAASASNLVIAEMMYHPPDASAAELAAGYNDADDFEYLRIQNVSNVPVDLQGVRFTLGITFDFSSGAVRYLDAGSNVLVVSKLAAFQSRYGSGLDSSIAGTYTGNLSNGGEALHLIDAASRTLHHFSYADIAPWPAAADGEGPSLVLRNPSALPDHSLPENWTISSNPGGTPGGTVPSQTYVQWRNLAWSYPQVTNSAVTSMEADPDLDGVVNFLEYAFGTSPHLANPAAAVSAYGAPGTPSGLKVQTTLAGWAMEVMQIWESSEDLLQWTPATDLLTLESETLLETGLLIRQYHVQPADPARPFFLRLRLTFRPPQ